MKKVFYLVVLLLPTTILLAQEKQQVNEQDVLNLANGPSVVSIECAGTCGCTLQGQFGGENDYLKK